MDYHVLTGQDDGNAYVVVYHLPFPTGNNRAGVAYRTALINSGLGGMTRLPDGDGTGGTISASEKSQIAAGELLEFSESFNTHPGETALQLRARVDARWTALANQLPGLAQARLEYFGFVRDVP